MEYETKVFQCQDPNPGGESRSQTLGNQYLCITVRTSSLRFRSQTFGSKCSLLMSESQISLDLKRVSSQYAGRHGPSLRIQQDLDHLAVLDPLRQAEFYYISSLRHVQLDQALLGPMVERWRQETQTFHFRHSEMMITLQDIATIFGLRVDGLLVMVPHCTRGQSFISRFQDLEAPDDIRVGQIRLYQLCQHYHCIHLDAPARLAAATHAPRYYIKLHVACFLTPLDIGFILSGFHFWRILMSGADQRRVLQLWPISIGR